MTDFSISLNHVVFISVLCLTTYIFCTYGGASIGVEMPNCTVGTTDSSSTGNIMYYEMPNCTVGTKIALV